MSKEILTQKRLKELLDYDHETGLFIWNSRVTKKTGFNKRLIRKIAGHTTSSGYIRIRVDGYLYLAHRLVFLYVDGDFPEKEVDHMDGVRGNNIYSNLRRVTRKENNLNKGISKANKTGYLGVHITKCRTFEVVVGGEYIGVYKTLEEAVLVSKIEYKRLGFHENHGARKAYKLK